MILLIQLLLSICPSFLRILILNLMGHQISRKAYIAPFAAVVSNKIIMGDYSQIRPFSILRCKKSIELGPYSEVSNFVIVNGDASLIIGLRSVIGVGSMVDVHADVILGEYSATGVKNVLMTHGLFWPVAWGYKSKVEPIIIGNLVWITSNVKILAGSTIEDEVIILPNSVIAGTVKKSIGFYSNSFDSKNVSVAFFREKLTLEFHKNLLRTVMTAFKEQNNSLNLSELPAEIEKQVISKFKVIDQKQRESEYIFYCGLPCDFIKNKIPKNTFIYDMQKLTYVSTLCSTETNILLKILRSSLGMRSMRLEHEDLIRVFNKNISHTNPKYLNG